MSGFFDEAIRTFNMARSYQVGARCLLEQEKSLPCIFKDGPAKLLLTRAIEFYLKAFLLAHGYTAREVCSFGHKSGDLVDSSVQMGLGVIGADIEIIKKLQKQSALNEDGHLSKPEQLSIGAERLLDLSETLFEKVGKSIAQVTGQPLAATGLHARKTVL